MKVLEGVHGLEKLAQIFETLAVDMPLAVISDLDMGAKVVKDKVDTIYGDESKLTPISQDSTALLRDDGGAGGPLFIDGEFLKDSVRIETVDPETKIIGSDNPIHVSHEFGYVTSPDSMIPNRIVPGRPVFHRAAVEAEPILDIIMPEGVAKTIAATIDAIV